MSREEIFLTSLENKFKIKKNYFVVLKPMCKLDNQLAANKNYFGGDGNIVNSFFHSQLFTSCIIN